MKSIQIAEGYGPYEIYIDIIDFYFTKWSIFINFVPAKLHKAEENPQIIKIYLDGIRGTATDGLHVAQEIHQHGRYLKIIYIFHLYDLIIFCISFVIYYKRYRNTQRTFLKAVNRSYFNNIP